MKGYSFRLGAVLRVRRVETLLARQRVGMAARELAAAVVRERDMDNNYEAAVGVLGEVAGTVFAAKREAGERLADILATAVGDRMKRQDHLGQERLGAVRRNDASPCSSGSTSAAGANGSPPSSARTSPCSTISPPCGQLRERWRAAGVD